MRNLFRLKKENKEIKKRVIGDTRNLFRLKKKIKQLKTE